MPQEEEEEERISLQHENMLLFFLSADFPLKRMPAQKYVFWVWVWAEGESILCCSLLFPRKGAFRLYLEESGNMLNA